jgi:hypothetical protein
VGDLVFDCGRVAIFILFLNIPVLALWSMQLAFE